ncbi:carboxylesterase type b [Diaporthe amygdali]|uniref:carboxylesterase type b n=1 Tax=Phomopsis amygdali TaxID=1214568 RepID=UPI0022FE547E|nr:carboxylesterase type b [Diaporthe amygdali]KAJ0114567.1 carboxylesterase type b [Diaporthe amygdali]
MESIREALAKFGNAWNNEVPPALAKLYGPIQAQHNKKYAGQIKAETAIKYGPDPRNRLDVYTPVEADTSGGSGKPVVVFIHGGGLVTGDNTMYANIGNYFTSNGYITCLVTYRLALQGGHHPNGAEDVASALQWIQANISKHGGDPGKVVAIGQSAGGLHLATAMFLGKLDPNPKPLVHGAVLLSAAFMADSSDPSRASVLKDWFQTDNLFEINQRWSPVAIFRQQFFGTATTPPREKLPCALLMMVGEDEADEILDGTFEFLSDYRKRFSKMPLFEVLKGHNHVSYTFGLGLDEPEYAAVGNRLLAFIKEKTA